MPKAARRRLQAGKFRRYGGAEINRRKSFIAAKYNVSPLHKKDFPVDIKISEANIR
jgi:hypothetical protein